MLTPIRNQHAGESLLICGCGTSLVRLPKQLGTKTIGVNDIGRLFDPTYLVVVNPPRQFRGDRFEYVRRSQAKALFTQLDLGSLNPPVVRFNLGRYGGLPAEEDEVLHYTQNSPYVAVCLAAYMGARRIGLLGVDFTEHHFFANTGRHPLAARLPTIDREYGALAQALAARGIELVNLSPISRLTSLTRVRLEDFVSLSATQRIAAPGLAALAPVPVRASLPSAVPKPAPRARRVFVVNYHFLTCGDVFSDGLRHAAAELGVEHAEAAWDDAQLPLKIDRFDPDLLLVVHGRRFAQRWGQRFSHRRSAVWLVDEPYEVDDTARWSHHFGTVFVNDPGTLARHRNAHLLPMAYDPVHCHANEGALRPHAVGFIGGASPTREAFLLQLAKAGLLSYLVGGPWRSEELRKRVYAPLLPHDEAAALYRGTRIVVNVFRDRHHYNTQATPALAMNPRIYEALASGALVVSERRAEIGEVFPLLPQFDHPDEVVPLVRRLLEDEAERLRLLADCRRRLDSHCYRDRLERALALACPVESDGQGGAPLPDRRPALNLVTPPAGVVPRAVLRVDPDTATAIRPRLDLRPLTGTPRRHLIYHLWPVRGSTWRWNLAQLLQRVDLFNGRRIVAMVLDERSEAPETVRQSLHGHGFEFIELANDARGEAISFPVLLDHVLSEGDSDVTFYAHAKGVKYEPEFPSAVKRWSEVLYGALLDHWSAVRTALDRHAMAGALRRFGRFANHERVGDWHYSGTFFWFRHDAVAARRARGVPQFYGGVEAWPGLLFGRDEVACLFLDAMRDLPYHDRFWATRGNSEFTRWTAAQRGCAIPPDLQCPPAFEGHGIVRLEQIPDEFTWWRDGLFERGARSLLVIGSPHGGVEWHLARCAAQAGRTLTIRTLHPGPAAPLEAALAHATAQFGSDWRRVEHLGDLRFDAAFIDADHGYAACRADVDSALACGVNEVALHDIVDSDWHAHSKCAVSRVWTELKARHRHAERLNGAWGGIGIAWSR